MIQEEALQKKIENKQAGKARSLANLTARGRPKGVPNKLTKSAQEVINKTFVKMGDVNGLYTWATKNEKNKTAFYTIIWPKVIPKNIDLTANIHHDIGQRLLEARRLQTQLEQPAPMLIEITPQGQAIAEKAIEQAVIETIEEEEREEATREQTS